MSIKRIKILNIWVDVVNRESAIQRVNEYLEQGSRAHSIFAANPEKNFSVPKDHSLYSAFRDADLLIPDGIGMVYAAKILYNASLSRVSGIGFMGDICGLAAHSGYKVFIYGATEAVNRSAAEILPRLYPGLEIVGRSNGYVNDKDMVKLIEKINKSQAHILFLALGSPKQEKWFARYQPSLKNIKICQGVGGSLDVITEKVKRAPEFWRKMSAEWLYRLIKEPRRLRRQMILPVFAVMVLWTKLKGMLLTDANL